MGFFNFFNHHSWLGGNDDNDDFNYNDNEGTKFVVGGDEGGKFLTTAEEICGWTPTEI